MKDLWSIDPSMTPEHQAEVNEHNQQVLEYLDEAPKPFDVDEYLYLWLYSDTSSVEVISSNIVAVGYQIEKSTMHVKFSSGATYRYHDVLFFEFWALINAESPGKYFATHIRNNRDIRCVKE